MTAHLVFFLIFLFFISSFVAIRIRRFPHFVFIITFCASLFMLYLTGITVKDYIAFKQKPPQSLTTEEITGSLKSGEEIQVNLQKATIDCLTFKRLNRRNSVVLIDSQKSIPIVGYFSTSGRTCEDLKKKPLTGTISELKPAQLTYLNSIGFDVVSRFPSASKLYAFCSYCGEQNSFIGLFIAPLLTAGCVFLCWVAGKEVFKRKRRK